MWARITIGRGDMGLQPSDPPVSTEYTWSQRVRFFALGAMWAALLTMGPVGITLWDWVKHYNDPIDWTQIIKLSGASAGPALVAYWQKHKALLKMPPGLTVPDEFRPNSDSGM
jgi:hypothetical protein